MIQLEGQTTIFDVLDPAEQFTAYRNGGGYDMGTPCGFCGKKPRTWHPSGGCFDDIQYQVCAGCKDKVLPPRELWTFKEIP